MIARSDIVLRTAVAATALVVFGFGLVVFGHLVVRLLTTEPSISAQVRRLAEDGRFVRAFGQTLGPGLVALGIQVAVVLGAVRYHRSLSPVARILLVAPALVSSTTAAVAWFLWLSPVIGPMGPWFTDQGVRTPAWFSDPPWMYSVAIAVDSWQWLPFLYAVVTYRIEQIPRQYFTQAEIEGASDWEIWRRITLPVVLPTIFIVGLIRVFDWLRLYDIVVVLFGPGGPGNSFETISIYVQKLTFQPGNEAYAATIALSYLALVLAGVLACFRIPAVSKLLPWNLKMRA